MSNNSTVVIKSIASLRQNPDACSELADEVLLGMKVEILEEDNDWLYIQTSYGYKGYLNRNDVLPDTNEAWESSEKRFIITSFADVLAYPKYSASCIISLPRGATVGLTGENQDKWIEVLLPRGQKGWIRQEALLPQSSKTGSELRYSIVETALLYLGTQYRWGGKTPMGIDCSGLSSMAYMMNEITIPRDSEDQMNFMRKVGRKESKPGDLLFFPGHVAVYIGEDKFVHATGTDAVVKVNSLNKDSKLYRKDLDEKYISTGTVF